MGQTSIPPSSGGLSEAELQKELGLSGDLSSLDAYLLLKVPDFGDTAFVNATEAAEDGIDPSAVNPQVLQSFLRLGAFDYASEPPAAKELLKMIPKAGAPVDPEADDPETEIVPGLAGLVFADDVRKHPQDVGLTVDDDPDHGLTMAERQDESARLYARGGWRDHSDGNRISTTWGDKVEVIRGNYKMIVLGRQNDPSAAAGFDISGGTIQDYASGMMPSSTYYIEWIDDERYYAPSEPVGDGQKGLWLLVNTAENMYDYSRGAGNSRSESWGDVHESYTGSENPPTGAFATDDSCGTAGHEPPHMLPGRNYHLPRSKDDRAVPPWKLGNKGYVRSNPHIIEKTWAERIDSWTGSEAWRVPMISEKTWAVETEDLTDVSDSVTSTTNIGGSQTDNTTISGDNTEETIIGSHNFSTTIVAGANTAIDIAAIDVSIGLNGASLDVSATGFEVGIEGYIAKLEVAVGLRLAVELGAWYEIQIGPHDSLEIPDANEKRFKKIESALQKTEQALRYQINSSTVNIAALDIQLRTLSVKLG